MGYDFSIGIMRTGNVQKDLTDFSMEESTIEMQLDEEKFNQHLAKFPGIERNGTSWLWNVPESGSLDISIYSPLIGIDTHADWLAVLEIYLYIYQIEPRAFLIEDADFALYNEKTFRDYIATPCKDRPPPLPEEYSLEALNHLLDALCSGNRPLGIKLFNLGEKAAPLLPRLIEILEHDCPEIELDIVNVISYIGNPAFKIVPRLVTLANQSKDIVFRRYIYIALGKIGSPEPSAISLLVNSIDSSEVWDRQYIIKSLLNMQQDPLTISLLFENMAKADMDHPGRWASGFADLFRYVSDAQNVIPELSVLLQQNNQIRRLVAAIAMDALATKHKNCEKLIDLALKDDWERVRRIATTTLSRILRSDTVLSKLNACLRDPDSEVRARASWAIGFGVIESS